MPGNALVQSLGRGLDLLRALAESDGGLRLADLAAATGLKRPTLHNLLRTLASRDFVTPADGLYRIGPALHVLAAEAASNAYLQQAEQAVRFLAGLLPDAIISFCEPLGGDVLVRFHLFPSRMLLQRSSESIFSPYQTASGLVFLAYADPETRHHIQMRHPFEMEAIQAWGTEARLEKFLKGVRARGYALPPFGLQSRFRLAARPHLSAGGRLLGIFGAAWPMAPDSPDGGIQRVLAALRETAARMPAPAPIGPPGISTRIRKKERPLS